MKKMNKTEAKAYAYMKDEITLSSWKIDKQIKELEIAQHLKMSRTPVRHALKRLVEEGYVYRIPYKGVFVRDKPLELSQRKERIYFLEAMLQHIFYMLQLDECIVEHKELSDKIEELRLVEPLKSNEYEIREIEFWKTLLSYHSNTYMNEQVIETMISLYQDSNQTPLIFKKSRTIKIVHYQNLLEWLIEKNYTYARREIRIMLNQLLVNLIQGVDE